MSTQNYRNNETARPTTDHTHRSNEGTSTSGLAKDAFNSAQEAGTEAASTIMAEVKSLLNDKVADGAGMVGNLANSVHTAAEELDQNSPQLASLVRGAASHLDSYASDLRDKSVDDLINSASAYTRRQPAVVFGLAALVGFFALRTIKSAPTRVVGVNTRFPQAGGFYGD